MKLNYKIIFHFFGLLLLFNGGFMLLSALVSLIYEDGVTFQIFLAGITNLIVGIIAMVFTKNHSKEMNKREGYMVVSFGWIIMSLSGTLPYLFTGSIPDFTNAFFETISGYTTTGASILNDIEAVPKGVLFWRSLTHWIGGMGIIVLAIAILPLLGIGGMQLFAAEAPGPSADKLHPRITDTAKRLYLIYVTLTLAQFFLLKVAGMTWFDAIGHSFSTVAIGGFSTHDESMGYFKSNAIDTVAIVFMLLSSANFSLHFLVWRKRNPRLYFQDSELRFYLYCVTVISLICITYLYIGHQFSTLSETIYKSLFQVVSMITTTGFTTSEYVYWTSFLPVLLIFSSFMGGCAGSTAGGMKVVRVLLLLKQGIREILRLIHPSARLSVKLNRKPVPDNVMQAVWGFFSVYIGIFVFFMLLIMATGLDQVTAFSAVAATLNNLGPGLGKVASNYAEINDFAKWVLTIAMLLGRLEIFTLLVVLTPVFWRQ